MESYSCQDNHDRMEYTTNLCHLTRNNFENNYSNNLETEFLQIQKGKIFRRIATNGVLKIPYLSFKSQLQVILF
jgi:hypothetical protein